MRSLSTPLQSRLLPGGGNSKLHVTLAATSHTSAKEWQAREVQITVKATAGIYQDTEQPHEKACLGVRVHDGGVNDAAVQAAQHAQVVLQGVPHQQRLRADEAQEPLLRECMWSPLRSRRAVRKISHSDPHAYAITHNTCLQTSVFDSYGLTC